MPRPTGGRPPPGCRWTESPASPAKAPPPTRIAATAGLVQQVGEKKDETALVEIAKLVQTPDLMSEAIYLARIAKVEAFIKNFPTSKKKDEVLKIHDTLDDERAIVAAGGVKFGGK